jgi:N-acetylmuramoyl-L-alanine amidase
MLRYAVVILMGAGLVTTNAMGQSDDWRAQVKAAIEHQQPPWSPREDTLAGWTIGLNPVGGGADKAALRDADDFSLLLAEYLYHAVIRSGGRAVLTRVGDYAWAADETPDAQQRVAILENAGVDLCISLAAQPADADANGFTLVTASTSGPGWLGEAFESGSDGGSRAASFRQALNNASPNVPKATIVLTAATGADPRQRNAAKEAFAKQIHAALVHYVAEHAKTDAVADDDAGGHSVPPTPDPPISRRVKSVARAVWPAGDLPLEQVDWFCNAVAARAITNSSLTYFNPEAELRDGRIVLTGATAEPDLIEMLVDALRVVGITEVTSEMRTLPDREKLGDELYGVCRVPMVLTFSRPDARRGLMTQLLFGEPVFLLDRDEDEYLLHAGDGYWGWVPANAIEPKTADAFTPYNRLPRVTALSELVHAEKRIPAGAKLPLVSEGSQKHTVLLPDGREAPLPADQLRALATEQSIGQRVTAVLDLIGTPYVFGGRSPLGLDCSGLVTNAMARSGEFAARDAWHQAFAGRLVATQWRRTDLQAGDLIFFINSVGKVYHTGVMIDDRHIIHATPPVVRINSLFEEDRLFDPRLDRDFFIGKRP